MIGQILIALVICFGLWFFIWRAVVKPALKELNKKKEEQNEQVEIN